MSAVTGKPLPEALMWFIENHAALPHDVETELFFELRSRYVNEHLQRSE